MIGDIVDNIDRIVQGEFIKHKSGLYLEGPNIVFKDEILQYKVGLLKDIEEGKDTILIEIDYTSEMKSIKDIVKEVITRLR